MKTILIAAATALALSGAATAVHAQDTGDTGRLYGSLGIQNSDNDKTNTNLSSVNARLGTKITPHFGVEGEAAFGTNKDNGVKLTSKWAGYGVGYLPVSSNFELLGRVGVSDTDLKASPGYGKWEQGTALDYGLGAQYHFNSGYAVRGDVTKSDFNGDKGSATTGTLSLVKKF